MRGRTRVERGAGDGGEGATRTPDAAGGSLGALPPLRSDCAHGPVEPLGTHPAVAPQRSERCDALRLLLPDPLRLSHSFRCPFPSPGPSGSFSRYLRPSLRHSLARHLTPSRAIVPALPSHLAWDSRRSTHAGVPCSTTRPASVRSTAKQGPEHAPQAERSHARRLQATAEAASGADLPPGRCRRSSGFREGSTFGFKGKGPGLGLRAAVPVKPRGPRGLTSTLMTLGAPSSKLARVSWQAGAGRQRQQLAAAT